MSKRLTTEEFIAKARKVHGDRFDYSLVEYVRNDKNILIVCKEHGVFKQTPINHTIGKCGCIPCNTLRPSSKRATTKEFITKAKEIHGDRYDYSLVEYTTSKSNVTIICKDHGQFEQSAANHLRGSGCRKCPNKYNNRKIDTETFIARAKEVHGDRYDYSLVEYTLSLDKVKIICKEHGVFEQIASLHSSSGHGCSACGMNELKRKVTHTKDFFVSKAREVHNDKFDYSKVEYIDNRTKVTIICPDHGEFEQMPQSHVTGKGGCRKCKTGAQRLNTETFISKAKEFHGDRYDYSLVDYQSYNQHNVTIICKEHGPFEQIPNIHIKGSGCRICSGFLLTTDIFIARAKEIHGDLFDYSLVEYDRLNSKVKIICKKHGIFEQRPISHLHQGTGCPKCKASRGERRIMKFLDTSGIKHTTQKTFKDLKLVGKLKYDFYLPHINTLIEYDGKQHFLVQEYFANDLEEIQRRDAIKTKYAEDNNIRLIRIPYWDYDNIETILESILKV